MKWEPEERRWPFRSPKLTLGAREVHVWVSSLEPPRADVERLRRTLAREESARAERFRFDRDRKHFGVSRGLLRGLLGAYADAPPEGLKFRYNAHGKPSLADEAVGGTLKFNLSHSCGVGLYAFARGRELGVDLERTRADFGGERIAERFFSPREAADILALAPDARPEAFFRCWTRKEAYVKALGKGLSMALDEFDVSPSPDGHAVILDAEGETRQPSRWSLHEINGVEGYVAALVVEGVVSESDVRQYSVAW